MAIITLTGPTCAGKSSVEKELQYLGFGRAISHTTRLPRNGEVNGTHYFFCSDEEFLKLEANGEFVEIVKIGSCRYAVSKQALLGSRVDGSNTVIVVDPHGADKIKQFCASLDIPSLSVWIDCKPEIQAKRWVQRLLGDFLSKKSATDVYSERLGLMLSNEVEWRKESQGYDLKLDSTWLHQSTLAIMIKVEVK